MKTSFLYLLITIVLLLGVTMIARQRNHIMDISQKVIDESIKVHGGKHFQKAHFSYDFRDKSYEYYRKKGDYIYTRKFTDKKTGNLIEDKLTNHTFERKSNGHVVTLESKKIQEYSNSVNSVNYFAFIPYFLNDAAVKKKYLAYTDFNDHKYHKIQVTFNEEGGGTDHDDVFVYWIKDGEFTLDYLGYSYSVNGGGVRFREAYNAREIGGIRFQDYINYKHEDKNYPVDKLDAAFDNGILKELSKIDLTNIKQL